MLSWNFVKYIGFMKVWICVISDVMYEIMYIIIIIRNMILIFLCVFCFWLVFWVVVCLVLWLVVGLFLCFLFWILEVKSVWYIVLVIGMYKLEVVIILMNVRNRRVLKYGIIIFDFFLLLKW